METRRAFALAACALLLFSTGGPIAAQDAPGTAGPGAEWSLAAAGDAIITRRISQFDWPGDPAFSGLVKVVREADAALVNLEISLFRLDGFKGWPEVENGGNWEIGPPEAAADLKAMGFDLFNRANNHTTDYGVEGMRLTNRLLDSLGLVHSGAGENLGMAGRPGYFESRKGRIALIGLATTFTPMSRAGAARPDMIGRPGLNALRVERSYRADPESMRALRSVAAKAGARVPDRPDAPVRLFGVTVQPGGETGVVETTNPRDEERILREIRNAAKLADFVVVNSHSHEPGNEAVAPPAWLQGFIKKCLDAGAATFIIHGPHQLRGIEIYKGKPIFYSLGNFVFQNETIDPMPSDNYEIYDLPDTALASDLYDARFKGGATGFPSNPVWYESVVAVPVFKGTELKGLKLYPIELGHSMPRSQRGTPRLADEALGRRIIERAARLSAPFGTRIEYRDGIGIWRPGP